MISSMKPGVVRENGQVFSVEAKGPCGAQTLKFIMDAEPHDSGSFGVVFQARLADTGEKVAIKKVLHDRRYQYRELYILKELNHCNVIKLKYYYLSMTQEKNLFLNLVFEYFHDNVCKIIKYYKKSGTTLPIPLVKLFAYQLFRGLAYIHSLGICHRDIKPQNLLINNSTGILKICDFGSAKHLVKGETHVSYICARHYRAPELIFGSTNYTKSIDVWSAGCVLAEMLLGDIIFLGRNTVEQMYSIITLLGTPTPEEVKEMNPSYCKFDFPLIPPIKQKQAFSKVPSEAHDLVFKLFRYKPSSRLTPLQACAHTYFDELRDPSCKFSHNKNLPPLFNFTEEELKIEPHLNSILIPPHMRGRPPAVSDSMTWEPETTESILDGNSSIRKSSSDKSNSSVTSNVTL